jgi:glycosyltransferase involved in cell wall biosynthesis
MENRDNPKISICVPVYEMNGMGLVYLYHLLMSLKKQTYKNFEVVISDHSTNDEIEKAVSQVTSMDIKYFRYTENKGKSSCNLNNAIKNSTGVIIKPLFQDDVLIGNEILQKIAYLYETDEKTKWGAFGFVHIDKENNPISFPNKPQIPAMNPDIGIGVNTFGCPSVCFFVKDLPNTLFDDELVWLMDCEFYHKMNVLYGEPTLIGDYDVAVRIWESFTAEVPEEVKVREDKYVREKHNIIKPEDVVQEPVPEEPKPEEVPPVE